MHWHKGLEDIPSCVAGSTGPLFESESIVYLTEFKDSSLASNPNIQVTVLSQDDDTRQLRLNVTSSAPAAFVSLETPIAGHFSDSNFMLLPWQPRTVTFTLGEGARVIEELFLDLLEILSLTDIAGRGSEYQQDCPAPPEDCSAANITTEQGRLSDEQDEGVAAGSVQAS